MPDKVIAKAEKEADISSRSKNAKTEIEGQIGIKNIGLPDASDIQKIGAAMKSRQKPAEFVISFDASGFSYFVRVDPQKFPAITIVKVNIDSSITDKEKVYKKLIEYGAATPTLVSAHKKKNPNQNALGPLRQQITDLENKIRDDQRKLTDLKKQYADDGGR